MELAVKTLSLGSLNPKVRKAMNRTAVSLLTDFRFDGHINPATAITNTIFSIKMMVADILKKICHKQIMYNGVSSCFTRRASCFLMTNVIPKYYSRESRRFSTSACAASAENVRVSASPFEDFSITTATTSKATELKIKVDVSGTKTQVIFDDVFSKMVIAAQPIPGFRRVKGGKTPNIPKDVLLHILGHSKVYMEVIKKIINWTIADYVEKKGLKVTSDLRVHQNFEELESTFEPGETFSFDAVIQLQEANL